MNACRFHLLRWLIAVVLISVQVRADDAVLSADFSVHTGAIRPLHGVNKGPLAPGGIIDVIKEQKELGIPFTRLHDCGWPNPYVIDHHVVFPNPDADPALPESYDFRLTDEYIDAVCKTGAEPIYRLGESIEHTSVKRYVHPPADMEKWAAVCIGIIRHYNEGWASGFHHKIRYWEIWNEPENRPAMWSGTDDDYLRLYRTAATAIKKQFPALKVGGPALGSSGTFVNGEFVPTEFATNFLAMCRRDNVPLNFFSWHCYTADPSELSARAWAIRRLLDSRGFTETENHLNEWNYLPGNSWEPIARSGTPEARQHFYEEMAGAAGAAFITTSLTELEDAPLDVGNFFHGELGGFGIFTEQGVPLKAYQGLRAFQGLVETPQRVETRGSVAGKLAFAAGSSGDGREATMLVSNFADPRQEFVLDWKSFAWTGGVTAEIHIIDAGNDFSTSRTEAIAGDAATLRLTLKAPAVALIRLRPTAGAAARTTLSVTAPANRLVFQRSQAGDAVIHVSGSCAWPGQAVEARIVDIETGKAGEWTALGEVQSDFSYRGKLTVATGWYSLEVRSRGDGNSAVATVGRFGVGEVFVVVGHSVAHGGAINLPGADDDRVNTIALPAGDMESQRQYRLTGDTRFLPDAVGRHFGSNVQPAPAGNGTYFWAAFAEHVAKANKVPVLLLNAAFGGTSLEHWAKSARGETFEHPFVNSQIRMPYVRLEQALTKYAAVTGLRAILSDQGQNDWLERDENKIVANYKAWIDQARKDAGFPNLAVVINRQSPPDGFGQIRRVQDRMIKEHPFCFAGADYDTLEKEDTVDKVHLSEAGAKKAAKLWADALDAKFFGSAPAMLAH
ncbi:sialate O-acetylesterase [Haloferula sp. BvORR071]|uniref:GH39 family glycosyl hydrolase n=1 Tax=Haloferula sp. BvORR071 TaxID=1396141 RepID=UPI00054F6CD9|nr:sialate O-acetylesterase [Haloferula sp. BvORR071]